MSLLFTGRNSSSASRRVSLFQRLLMGIINHMRQALASLGELWRSPLATIITIGVLGLSITLPSTLYLMVKNTEKVTAGWEDAGEISLYLQANTTAKQAQKLLSGVSAMKNKIDDARLISPDLALEEFETLSGLGDALAYLDANPLPYVLLITPKPEYLRPEAARQLLSELEQQSIVDFGKLDIEWLEKLYAIVSIAKDIVWIVAILLCVSVVLIIGNTIRLNILSQREAIAVMKLVGATDNFIRFPFLYTGFWYGILGGFLAWMLVAFLLWWIQSGVENLAGLYRTSFTISGLDGSALGIILMISITLGLIGSLISVQKHIKEIEPS